MKVTFEAGGGGDTLAMKIRIGMGKMVLEGVFTGDLEDERTIITAFSHVAESHDAITIDASPCRIGPRAEEMWAALVTQHLKGVKLTYLDSDLALLMQGMQKDNQYPHSWSIFEVPA